MSTWRLLKSDMAERPDDYTMTLTMMNVGTGKTVTLALTQERRGPASDLVGALRATSKILIDTASEYDTDEPGTARMH